MVLLLAAVLCRLSVTFVNDVLVSKFDAVYPALLVIDAEEGNLLIPTIIEDYRMTISMCRNLVFE